MNVDNIELCNVYFQELKNNLHLENPHFRTHVISLGHIAYYCPSLFQSQMKNIVTKIIVQKLLMQDNVSSGV